ncbi:MAG: hypothetical protein LUI05_01605 [Oscillospiraceae bacterium]|nr:hypothetical protein [Oscillospiraceae bacterium]
MTKKYAVRTHKSADFIIIFYETPYNEYPELLEKSKQDTEKQGVEKQGLEILGLENLDVENQPQLITKESNTKELNTKYIYPCAKKQG